MKPSLLFFRDYRAFQGGHLKLADYIAHTAASGLFTPRLFMTPASHGDHPFPRDTITPSWQPHRADALFLAGMDWVHLPIGVEEHVPVINLIQHPRHAMSGDPRHAFLPRRAIRICVSKEVSRAIARTGRANGPIHTIPAGMDISALPSGLPRSILVLVCGIKNPTLAAETARVLRAQGVAVTVLDTPLPRRAYLETLARARIAITLPDPKEGFYLPALEAMAAGCLVICPDALGNRSFCRHGETCLMPPATAQDLAQAARDLLATPTLARHLLRNGQDEARARCLEAERAAFLPLLRTLRAAIRPVSTEA